MSREVDASLPFLGVSIFPLVDAQFAFDNQVTYDGASPVASQFYVVPNGTDSLSVTSDLSSPTSFLNAI